MNDTSVPQFASAPAAADTRVVFDNQRPDFRRMVLRGAFLELVTVGFYRFWLATSMRLHLWSHTSVDGDAPEYTGTAKELLIGFLFALAVLVPLYLAYFQLGLELGALKAFAGVVMLFLYYVFLQFAIYRARRYRVTRTVWRGVRFSMRGSGLNYAWRVGLWTLLVIITLGLALPWRQAALERFKMRHTAYGHLQGRFEGTGGQLFRRGWWLWFVSFCLVALPVFGWVITFAPLIFSTVKIDPIWFAVAAFLQLGFLVLTVAAPFIYGLYKSFEWRWWASGVRFGDVQFSSDLRRGVFIGLYWKVIGWNALLVIGLAIWAGAAMGIGHLLIGGGPGNFPQTMLLLSQHWGFLIASGLGYVVVILALWAVMRIYLIHDVWQRVAESATVHNLAAAADVAAQGEMAGALGEGLADSLDVVGF
jgi:uncharacterized membrane protein YjgN (DUF898 family)